MAELTTPKHCPGFEANKDLKVFSCKCPNCGHANEIFSDEFDRPRKCSNCGTQIDFTKCVLDV